MARAWGEGAPEMMAALPHSPMALLLERELAFGATWIAGTKADADAAKRGNMLAKASHWACWNIMTQRRCYLL